MKSAKWWMGMLAAGLFAGMAGKVDGAIGDGLQFRGGHPWLSKSQSISSVAVLYQNDLFSKRSTTPRFSHHETSVANTNIRRIFDITVSMYKHRTDEDRKKIEACFSAFAQALYEATEGRHCIGKVRFIESPSIGADIVWEEKGHPHADMRSWSLGTRCFQNSCIHMYDVDDRNQGLEYVKYLEYPLSAGLALGHEWCHYCYGFGDEYAQTSKHDTTRVTDIAVFPSLMGDGFTPLNGNEGRFAKNCNLSIKYNDVYSKLSTSDSQRWWRNTGQTHQHRLHGKSCMELLVSTPMWEDDFKGVSPDVPPTIDLENSEGKNSALLFFDPIWMDEPRLKISICLDRSGSMNEDGKMKRVKEAAKTIVDVIPEGNYLELVPFNTTVAGGFSFREVTDENRAEMKAAIDAIMPGGGTHIWDGAWQALDDMDQFDPDRKMIGSLFLLSDGQNGGGTHDCPAVVERCQTYGVAFNSISCGAEADSELGVASSETGGRNLFASGLEYAKLLKIFNFLFAYGASRETICAVEEKTTSDGIWRGSFTVDSTAKDMQVAVTLSVSLDSSETVLVSPSGLRYAAKVNTTVGEESSRLFLLEKPEPGLWTVSVTAPSETSVVLYADTGANAIPPRLSLMVDEDDTTVYASLSYGAPVDGAVVKAVFSESGVEREVPFAPMGEGIYKLALSDCGAINDGFIVRADAAKDTATYTYAGVMDYMGDDDGTPIPESFTRSEWLDLSGINVIPNPSPVWQFVITNGVAVVTGASNAFGAVAIPSTLGGYPVTSIGDWAFKLCTKLMSVTIPDSVTFIGNYAFEYCSGLTSVTIGNGVTSIGEYAFYDCSGLTSVTIPNSVTRIEDCAFYGCSGLIDVTIGSGVMQIGYSAFEHCDGLTNISVSTRNSTFASKDGVLVSKDGKTLICCPAGKTGAYSIPNGVTNIAGEAFAFCSSLTSLIIPDSVQSIAHLAFWGCNGLTDVTIGSGVTSIGDEFAGAWGPMPSIFDGCSGLTNIAVSANNSTFASKVGVLVSKDGEILICCPDGKMGTYSIPDGVTHIGVLAFGGCSGLTSVTIPDSVTFIGYGAFGDCSGLTSVAIPDSVTFIGEYAFGGCSGLTSVAIPDSVTFIGENAFEGCSGLTNIAVSSGNSTFASKDGVLFSKDGKRLVCCPGGKTGMYSIPNGVASIGNYAFEYCSGLTGVTIPDSVTFIGNGAFGDCSGLTGVTIPDSVTFIGYGAFGDCSGLTGMTIPDSVTSIGARAFWDCNGLTNMTIGNGMTNIGYWAFGRCSSLKILYVPASWEGTSMLADAAVPGGCTVVYGLPQLELGASGRTFSAAAASGQKLTVTANVAWTAKSSATWLTVATTNGNGSGSITYSVAANASTNSRTGTITVTGEGLTRTFKVTQNGAAAALTLGASSQSFTAAAASGQKLAVTANVPWTAKSSATWLTLATTNGSGNGTITYRVAANTVTDSRTGTITVAGGGLSRTFKVTQSGVAAVLTLGASSQSFTAAAASGQKLTVTGNVAWTAKSSASWLSVATTNGSGNGTISYSVAANAATNSRTGTITVAGGGLTRTFKVTQSGAAAALTLGASSQGFTAAAASGQKLTVTGNVAWTAKSSASWLTVATTNGNGSGTITYSVAANAATNSRTGTITVAGGGLTRTFKVTQSEAAATLELAGSERTFTAAAASGKLLGVTANVPWTAKSSSSWLTVKTASGSGNGNIEYAVTANTGATRTGTITVSGGGLTRTFTVTQEGKTATLELGASERTFSADAASGKLLGVTANVSWTAKSSASWLTVKTASGSGNGNIEYAVSANTGAARTGTITVTGGGVTRTFTVTQNGAAAKLELGTTGQGFTADAAGGQKLTVTANVAWTATSGAEWLTVTAGSGTGNGSIAYNVAANTGTEERTGAISVTGGGLTRIFLVTQSGAAAALELAATSKNFTANAISGQKLGVTANVAWTATSSVSWLAVTTGSGMGNGTITYTVAANTGTGERMGAITVTGGGLTRIFLAMQAGKAETQEPVAVPRAWLEANAAALLAANGGDCVAAAQAEAENGRAVWECYVAGLSVTNAAEEFKVLSVEIVDGVPQVEWNPDLNEKGTKTERTYRLWGKQKLDDSEWTDVTDVSDLEAEGWRYFRVGVRMPEQ